MNLLSDLVRKFETWSLTCLPNRTLGGTSAASSSSSAPLPATPPASPAASSPVVLAAFLPQNGTPSSPAGFPPSASVAPPKQVMSTAPSLTERTIACIASRFDAIQEIGLLIFSYSHTPFDYCLTQHTFTCWQAHVTAASIAKEATLLERQALCPIVIRILPPTSADVAPAPIQPLFGSLSRAHPSIYMNLQRLQLPVSQFNRLDLLSLFARARGLNSLEINCLAVRALHERALAGITEECPTLTRLILENCAISARRIEQLLALELHASIRRVTIAVTLGIRETLTYDIQFDRMPLHTYHYVHPASPRFLKITPLVSYVFTWSSGPLDPHLLLAEVRRGRPTARAYSVHTTLTPAEFLATCMQFLQNPAFSISRKTALFLACCKLQDQEKSWQQNRNILGSIFHSMRSLKNPCLNPIVEAWSIRLNRSAKPLSSIEKRITL